MSAEEALLFLATLVKWYVACVVVFGIAALALVAWLARRRRVRVQVVNRIDVGPKGAAAVREFVRKNNGDRHAN